jgi:hypothetical protein
VFASLYSGVAHLCGVNYNICGGGGGFLVEQYLGTLYVLKYRKGSIQIRPSSISHVSVMKESLIVL